MGTIEQSQVLDREFVETFARRYAQVWDSREPERLAELCTAAATACAASSPRASGWPRTSRSRRPSRHRLQHAQARFQHRRSG